MDVEFNSFANKGRANEETKSYSRLKTTINRVSYVCDELLLDEAEKIPNIGIRNKMVALLIKAYNILPSMRLVESTAATEDELTNFHSTSYIEYLKTVDENSADCGIDLEYGLGYDCPPLESMFDFASRIAGGTLTAVRQLTSFKSKVAINWCGGWHHAQRDEAEGFCYVNDIVIGIENLRKVFPYVLYIDFDIHHGNGVQNAYYYTSRVFTLSFHKFEPGFYPTTGSVEEVGEGPGRYFCANVPLSEGFSDADLRQCYDQIVPELRARFQPDAVVLQFGADCLPGDPVGNFNVTPSALGYCLRNVLDWQIPTLILGGGGYNLPNTARCWTYLTAVACNLKLQDDIPDNPYFSQYGPGFDLEITASSISNMNHKLKETIAAIRSNLELIEER